MLTSVRLMRRALAFFALLATLGLHWLDVYQKQRMSVYFHPVYVDGQMRFTVDVDGFEKAQPKADAYVIAMMLNAPSGALVLPIVLATSGTDAIPPKDLDAFHTRILWEFGLFGILVWYAAGTFIDDMRLTFSADPEINLRWYDWIFSVLCLASGFILIAGGWGEADLHTRVACVSVGLAWMLLGTTSILFRLFQWRSLRRTIV